jgi:hypothetical protein
VAFRITARRNGYTSSERVQDFLLLRAAEIAISRGRKEFIIITVVADQSRVDQRCAADSRSVNVRLTGFHPMAVHLYGQVTTSDKASSGILSHTLFVVVSASMKIAMPATSRSQAAIFMHDPQARCSGR